MIAVPAEVNNKGGKSQISNLKSQSLNPSALELLEHFEKCGKSIF